MAKISMRSNEFIQPIADALAKGKELVIWHQIPWSGGNQEWFLIRHLEALDKVLDRGRVASAFTVYEWHELPLPHIMNEDRLAQAYQALAQETHNQMLLILQTTSDDEPLHQLTWVGEAEDLREYYEQHVGSAARVGRIPSTWTEEIIRGYYPDANGVPQSGPY